MKDLGKAAQTLANQAELDTFLDFLRAKFPSYIFTAETPCALEFNNVDLWVEFNVDVLTNRLMNGHFKLVVKRKCGVAEAVAIGGCATGCFPVFVSNDVADAAQEWIIEQQLAHPKEWRNALTLKCDVPLFDTVANDLHDFSESIVFCARDFSPHFHFVSHSGLTATVNDSVFWTRLCVTMRYKNEIAFSVVISRSPDAVCVATVEVVQFQFMHFWQYLKFGNHSLLAALFASAQEWERRHRQEHSHTWLHFVKGREWIVAENPLSDKNEQLLDSFCGTLKSAGGDIRLFARNIVVDEGEWKSIEVSFCLFDEIKYYVLVDRESSMYRPKISIHKYFLTAPFSLSASGYNTPFKKIQDTLRVWLDNL